MTIGTASADLQAVIDLWPDLPEAIKASILVMCAGLAVLGLLANWRRRRGG